MARRGDVTLSWYIGKRAIHKQCAYGMSGGAVTSTPPTT
jgi:hypothetical protein